jgi:hypothetical protein
VSYAVVQHTSGSGTGTSLTTGKTLGSTPTAGNWLIAAVCLQQGSDQTLCPINTTDWFLVDDALGFSGASTTDNIVRIIARKVVGGDTTTMPAFCTSGSAFNAWMVVEISGGSGTWATDFHSARNHSNRISAAAIASAKDTSLVANTFALAFAAAYNETAAGSWSAGWTVDENTFNSGNYGSWGCAHQAFVSSGSSVQATFTKAGTNTNAKAIVTILLTPSQPTTVHIKRHRTWSGSASGIPGAIKMGGDPANGHLLRTYLYWKDGSAAAPTVSGSWTNDTNATNGTNPMVLGLYRYASSDTRTLPALCTAGTSSWAADVVELGGVSGTFASDHVSSKNGYQASGATMVTTSDATTAANQIATTGFINFSTTGNPVSVTGADLLDYGIATSAEGCWGQSEQYAPSSSTTVQTTWTPPLTTAKSAYIQDIWGAPAANTETGTAIMAMSGISYAASGHRTETGAAVMSLSKASYAAAASRTETGSGALHLSGISFVATGQVIQVFGAAVMSLSGIRITASAFNVGTPGKGVRQFWTF